MTNAPISVHVAGGGVEHHLYVKDLSFTRSAVGGFSSATFTLPEWVDSDDPALAPASRVMVDDGRTATRLFEGYLDIPGRTVDDAGHTWAIGAIGAQSILGDRSRAYISVDASFEGWQYRNGSNANMTAEASSVPTDDTLDALVFQWPNGSPIGLASFVSMRYARLADNAQTLGSVKVTHVEGLATTNNQLQVRVSTRGVGAYEYPIADNWTTGSVSGVADAGGTAMTVGHDIATIQMIRVAGGATNVSLDTYWSAVTDVLVIAARRLQSGTTLSGVGSYNDYVLAHEVIVDALYWLTNAVDIPNASIDTSFTYPFTQLAYPDGIRLPDLLNDVALLEPTMLWQVGASNLAGLHSFTLRKWPTDVRYEATTIDGYSQPGGEVDLANSLRVYWTDKSGDLQSTVYTTTVPQLGSRVRDAEPVQLGSEIGTQAAADTVAAAILAQISTMPYAGTLTVARPIRDLYTGRMVQPWEIEPGYLVDVRDDAAPPMQLTEMSYSDSDMSASLTLGTPTFTTDQVVARLVARRTRRGSTNPNPIGHTK